MTLRSWVLGVGALALGMALLPGCGSTPLLLASSPCADGEMSVHCCLKQLPGQWDRCGASPPPATGSKVPLVMVAAVAGAQPHGAPARPKLEDEFPEELQEKVEEALEKCAREAEEQVNRFEFHRVGKSAPDEDDCARILFYDRYGEAYTVAKDLGRKKHAAARACLRVELQALIPGRFLLEPRYRYNPQEQTVEYYPSEMVHAMSYSELRGTLEPDVVLHALDNPLVILLIFDFKFPCPPENSGRWRTKSRESWGADDLNQGKMYKDALGVQPRIVTPRRGVRP